MVTKKLKSLLSRDYIQASLVILCVVLTSYVIAPLLGRSQNPIYHKSGLSTVTQPGYVSGQNTIDPNDGFTSQALGKASAQSLLSGDMPYWNHYEGVGAPLAGGMQGASLFPLVIVQALDNGLVYFHFLLQVIAGIAAYLFFKKLKLSQLISIAGGVLFALNGTFAWLTNAPFNPVAFLPLLLLGMEYAITAAEQQKRRGWILIAIALSLSLYAGFPETAFLNAIFAYGWGLVRILQIKPAARKIYIAKVALGSIVGLLLAAPILVAFLGYLSDATTGGHEGGGFANIGLPLSTLPALVMPYIFGPIFGLVKSGQPIDLFLFWSNVGGYVTVPLVLISTFSIFSKRPRSLKLYLALFILVVVLKMFAVQPVSFIVNLIPGMELIAFYRYSVPVLSMALIMLAMFGLEALAKKQVSRKNAIVVTILAFVCTGLLGLFSRSLHSQLGAFPAHKLWAALSLFWATGLIILIATSILYKKKRVALWGLAGILTADALFMFIIPLFSLPKTTPVNTGPVTFLQQNLGQQRFYTFYPIQPNYGSYFQIASINTNNLPVPKKWAEYIEEKLDKNVDAIVFTGFSRHQADGPSALEEFARNLSNYESVGVKYVVAQKGLVTNTFAGNHNLVKVYDDNQVEIYALPSPRPYFGAENCSLESSSFNTVLADCTQQSQLIRRELYMPGWEAKINGKPAVVSQTDEIFQAVDVPSGKARITFTYTPPYITSAYVAFTLGLLAIAGSLLAGRSQRDKRLK